jgi:hypothetical protein
MATEQYHNTHLPVFVFGSNLAGRHGKGAALTARIDYGAEMGVARGPTGNAYAIPTKTSDLKPLSLEAIYFHIQDFLLYARKNKHMKFFVTRVGCGLAGYKDEDIAPMFRGAPNNCELPEGWDRGWTGKETLIKQPPKIVKE